MLVPHPRALPIAAYPGHASLRCALSKIQTGKNARDPLVAWAFSPVCRERFSARAVLFKPIFYQTYVATPSVGIVVVNVFP